MGCGDEKLSKYLTQTFTAHCNAMICQQVTLSGDAEWLKVADAVIEARKSLLHGEEEALDIHVEVLIEERFIDAAKRVQLGYAGVREEHVYVPMLFFDGCIQAVKIAESCDVALDCGDM